jgi:competence protein ComEC
MRVGRIRGATVVLALALLLMMSSFPQALSAEMLAHIIDVGQGDAILLELPGHGTTPSAQVLVDGGMPQKGPTVVAYLDEQGVEHLDLIVATHPDHDHIGGLPHVLQSFPVQAVWVDGQDCDTLTCQTFDAAMAERGLTPQAVRHGEQHDWGKVQAMVLNPTEPLYASANDNSVVLHLDYGGVGLMLTGDAGTAAEARMMADDLFLEAQVLKVAHHGSKSSSTDAFLTSVQPEKAIISVGAENRYGHPHDEALTRLKQAGATIWRTDLEGTVVVRVDGETGDYHLAAESGRASAPAIENALFLPLLLYKAGEAVVPTPTPTATPTSTPEAPIVVEAWVSNETPSQYSTVTVYGRIHQNGLGIPKVPMHAVWHYRTTTSDCGAVSGADGVAACERNIGRASAEYRVRIVVTFTHAGETYVAETGFTPQLR